MEVSARKKPAAQNHADAPPLFELHSGHQPVLISLPHDGDWIPADIVRRLRPEFHHTPDRDWYVSRLYDWAVAAGFSVIRARVSRYVVDLNRPPDNRPLYPGAATPGLCPLRSFAGSPLYRAGQEPDAAEIALRLESWWRPYHDALQQTLDHLRQKHGQVLLWDAHSIRSQVPELFAGRLPAFNLGTNSGRSCAPELQRLAESRLRQFLPRSVAINARFVGGYITRHYGAPEAGIHALQMEIAQRAYLDETRLKLHHGSRATADFLRQLLHRLSNLL